jgi:predicted enzyme related to lactoylglutathione lyase
MARIVHFELPYDDGGRARKFYEEVFGWLVQGWGEMPTYQLATTGSDGLGIDGALYQRRQPDLGVLVYVAVPDVIDALDRAERAGATVVQPKTQIGGVGYSAVLRDPEGNLLGLFESEESVTEEGS